MFEVDPVPVWSYWQGPLPPWRYLCLKTLRKHVPGITILTPETWQDVRKDDLGWKLNRLAPNIISDFVRAHQLFHYGGIWVDADCIAFRDLRPIADRLEKYDFVTYRAGKPSRQICSALIASRAGGAIACEYLGEMTRLLKSGRKLGPLTLGPNVLVKAEKLACRKVPRTWMDRVPTSQVHPIHWRQPEAFHRRATDERHARYFKHNVDPFCCMLTAGSLREMRHWDEDKLLKSDTLFSYLLRTALAN